MGEENIKSNCHLFFWKAEDMGTEKGEWQPIEVDNVKVRLATDIQELEVKEPWPTCFSFTATLENTDAIAKFNRKLREHQNRRFHYIQKILPRETKDYFRKLSLEFKVKKFKKK